jgi:hypothetical protein
MEDLLGNFLRETGCCLSMNRGVLSRRSRLGFLCIFLGHGRSARKLKSICCARTPPRFPSPPEKRPWEK